MSSTSVERRPSYALVLRVPYARRTFAAALLGRLSYGIVPLSATLAVTRASGSYAVAGTVMALFGGTSVFLSPARAALIDRCGPRRALVPMVAAYASLLGLLTVLVWRPGVPSLALGAATAAAGACTPPLGPTMRAVWGRLAPDRALLQRAYSLDGVAEELLFVSGPLLVGVLVGIAPPTAGIVAGTCLMAAGTAAFVSSPPVRAMDPAASEPRPPRDRRTDPTTETRPGRATGARGGLRGLFSPQRPTTLDLRHGSRQTGGGTVRGALRGRGGAGVRSLAGGFLAEGGADRRGVLRGMRGRGGAGARGFSGGLLAQGGADRRGVLRGVRGRGGAARRGLAGGPLSRRRGCSRGILRGILQPVAGAFGVGLALGAVDLVVVAFAGQRHCGDDAVAWTLAALSAGSAAGGLLNGTVAWRAPARARLPFTALGLGLALLGAGFATGLGTLALALAAAGFFVAPALTTAYLVADDTAAPEARVRAGAWVNTGVNAGSTAGSAGAGLLLGGLPTSLCFAAAGAAALLTALATARGTREPSSPRTEPLATS